VGKKIEIPRTGKKEISWAATKCTMLSATQKAKAAAGERKNLLKRALRIRAEKYS